MDRVRIPYPSERTWKQQVDGASIGHASVLSYSSESGRRVYADDRFVYKVSLVHYEGTTRPRTVDLLGEYRILMSAQGINGIPVPASYYENNGIRILKVERLGGKPIGPPDIRLLTFALMVMRLSRILLRLSCRGLSHNDVTFDNILVDGNGGVNLIDYDQATRSGCIVSLYRSFCARRKKGGIVHGSIISLTKDYIKQRVPAGSLTRLRRFLRKGDVDAALPVIPDAAGCLERRMLEAWRMAQRSDASSPGVQLAYYSLDYLGYHFPGERPWAARWATLRSITDCSGRRILELGCNMALLSSCLLKEGGAAACLAVDVDPQIIEAARLVASALGVCPDFRIQDFDAPEMWEDELEGFKPDIVFALNVLQWVRDKGRLMAFLGRFHEIIFEGHDSVEMEMRRFRDIGFSDIRLVTITERKRPLMYCRK